MYLKIADGQSSDVGRIYCSRVINLCFVPFLFLSLSCSFLLFFHFAHNLVSSRNTPTMSAPQLTQFVKRPGVGRAGRPVNVRSNFFPVTGLPNKSIYHYDISISTDMPPTVNRRLFSEWVSAYKQSDLGGANPVFDGRRNMFSSEELPFESRTFDVNL